jgi:hypothetical protein
MSGFFLLFYSLFRWLGTQALSSSLPVDALKTRTIALRALAGKGLHIKDLGEGQKRDIIGPQCP